MGQLSGVDFCSEGSDGRRSSLRPHNQVGADKIHSPFVQQVQDLGGKLCVLDGWPCHLALCHSSKLSLSFLTRAASGVQVLCVPGLYPVLPDLCPQMDFTPTLRHTLPAVWSPLRMLLRTLLGPFFFHQP